MNIISTWSSAGAILVLGFEPIRTRESLTEIPAIVLQLGISLDVRAPWNVAICATIIFVCFACVQHTKTNILIYDYSFGTTIAALAMDAIHMTLLVQPLHTFRHQKQIGSAHELPWFKRFVWASQLCASPRGVGWDHQIKQLPEHSAKSRQEFVRSHLMNAAKHFLWLDITLFYIRHDPAYQSAAAFASQTFVPRLLSCGAFFVWQYCMGATMHSLITALVVSCTSSEPSSWPFWFGKWEDAYTIKRFWGRTWHQFFRRFLSPFGRKMASFLGFKPGTNGSSFTQLYTAFFISSIVHLGGDAVVNSSHLGISCPFFIYQALAITFEDMVIAAARRAGVRETKGTRMVGYAWVICWFIVTAIPWIAAMTIAELEGGGKAIPFDSFPPSLCDVFLNFLGVVY